MKIALEVACKHETILVGSDTDLLILLCHFATTKHKNIFFQPQPKLGSPVRQLNIQRAQTALGKKICTNLLFIHAQLGCNTTSRFFGHGKAVGLSLMKNPTFIKSAEVFCKSGVSKEDVTNAGEKAIISLYNSKTSDGLNRLRHQRYQELLMT